MTRNFLLKHESTIKYNALCGRAELTMKNGSSPAKSKPTVKKKKNYLLQTLSVNLVSVVTLMQ